MMDLFDWWYHFCNWSELSLFKFPSLLQGAWIKFDLDFYLLLRKFGITTGPKWPNNSFKGNLKAPNCWKVEYYHHDCDCSIYILKYDVFFSPCLQILLFPDVNYFFSSNNICDYECSRCQTPFIKTVLSVVTKWTLEVYKLPL